MNSRLQLSGWRYQAIVASVVFSTLGYLGFSLWGGWQEVSSAFTKVGVFGVIAALAMSSINYALRFMRWQMYLHTLGHSVPWKPSLKIYLAGFALTTTPGRAGEALRGILLKPLGVPYAQSFAAFFSERLSDLVAIAGLTFFGMALYPNAGLIVLGGFTTIILGFLVVSKPRLITYLADMIPATYGKVRKLALQLCSIFIEAQRCNRLGVLLSATVLGVVACSAEALAFYWILTWMGTDIPFMFAIFVYALALLAGALSFMPGGLGGTEAVMAVLLISKGVSHADAIASTILIRACTLWFSVTVGACSLLHNQLAAKINKNTSF